MNILILTKRQYMAHDLLDDRFGRFREIPLALAGKGHRVTGICLSYKNKPSGWFYDSEVRWRSFNAGYLKILGLIRFSFEAFYQARKHDVIWACSDSFYGIIGCVIGTFFGIPVVFDIYDNFDEFAVAKLPIIRQLYHLAIKKCTAVTCLSNSFKEYILNKYATSQTVVPIEFAVNKNLFRSMDKIECRQRLNIPVNSIIIGTAGALFKIREVPLLFQSFICLKKQYPNLLLAVAGPRDFEFPESEDIIDLGILPHDQVPIFINALDIAVVCYANDNFGKYCFPQKTREFMACKIPVVAANVGALKEIFNNRPEWLYEAGQVESLTKVIENRLRDRSSEYYDLPTWTDLAIILECLFKELLNEQSSNSH